MPIKDGSRYVNSINRLNPAVIIDGERIRGPVSEHPAFRGLVATQAALYDMQCDEKYMGKMTYSSPSSGEPVGLSFLSPETKTDLARRRTMMSLWAGRHHGFMGRSPDYMNVALTAYASAADVLARSNPEYADNLRQYYIYCRERDITLSHAFVIPAGCRISAMTDSFEDTIAPKVLDRDSDGMTVSGAFLMATQAATAEEILIFPPPGWLRDTDCPHTFAFAIPIDTPGVTLVCRESHARGNSAFDYPLSSRFEEMDCLVLCDRVRVPRDRIFLYGEPKVAEKFTLESRFHAQVSHQSLCRYVAKTEFFLGTAESLAKLCDAGSDTMYAQISEIIMILEILTSLLAQAERKAKKNKRGVMIPDWNAMLVANSYFPSIYPRLMTVIQSLASSRLVMIPSEKNFQGEAASDLQKVLGMYDEPGRDVVALNRLAWELSANAFAGRQAQYERLFFGNPSVLTNRLYQNYKGKERLVETVRQFLKS